MPSNQLREAVDKFLVSDKPEVLCIRGAWGTGKTYAWKHWLNEQVKRGMVSWRNYSYCTLFGMNSLADMRAGLFENKDSLAKDMPGVTASFWQAVYFVEKVRNWIRTGSWAAGQFVSMIPYTGKLGEASPRALFWFVRKQLVCIDDIERRGSNLTMSDVLGMIAFLKEERGCKVVIILNDARLEGKEKEDFNRYLEKVADVSMAFDPTVSEAAEIGLGVKNKLNTEITTYLEALDIRNIRVIQKIRRLVDDIEPMLWGKDPRLLVRAAKTLCALGWVEYMPDSAPPWDFAKQRFMERAFSQLSDGEPPEQKVWNQKLDALDLGDLTEFDMSLQIGVRQGYFDKEALEGWISLMETRLANEDADKKLSEAWELFFESLTPSEDEVIAALSEAVKGAAHRIPNGQLNSVVVLFRKLGRETEATELMEYVWDPLESTCRHASLSIL